ncbi:hypothetical protein GCV64_14665 [Listeria monocytogenes]|uniref:Uncharacterized protein n=1 Tax=Listeria monocytogenes TaxID=1639 RepID=A0A9P2FGX6_LISMN|nr:hypothetical protein [Listeria monocytogenes]EAC5235005.1 hypothetical protein [Listeria monocytogenes]EAD2804389.1 hypothetical protein [Listeria monocytogenes]EDH0842327.1 hypothetical protein [Listeria monocytogenes]EJS5844740.1 hypothetical protein [Listeria monocytogenes]
MEGFILKNVTKEIHKEFKREVLNKEVDFFNGIIKKWGYDSENNGSKQSEFIIPLVKGKTLPYLEVRIYPLVEYVNVVIDYYPDKSTRIIPLQRSNSALAGLKIISEHLVMANKLKDEKKIDNYFKDVNHKVRDDHN